jgi:hypothetical protein
MDDVSLFSQSAFDTIAGEVSFVTSNNIYVKFKSTSPIEVGDSLYVKEQGVLVPCMVVTNKSSTSTVCTVLDGCTATKGQQVFAIQDGPDEDEQLNRETKDPEARKIEETEDKRTRRNTHQSDEEDTQAEVDEPAKAINTGRFKESISGSISLATYSNISDTYNDLHRAMTRVAINADHIRNSGWSFEGYANYRRNYKLPNEGETEVREFYRIYNLALTYDIDSSFSVSIGRKINRRASSLGAVDGVQAEKHFGNFYTGLIAGFRPDIYNYSLNTNLFEYGVYGGFESTNRSFYGATTIGLLEQQNAGNVDRRYIYLQHNSSLGRSLYLFGSAEMDLFSNINGNTEILPRLTNLFVSARYRLTRKIDFTLSYDSRRQIVFYETFKTDIERLLEDDEARQGIRARVNFRPFRFVSSGISYSKRFQNSLQNPSDNINGYISISRLPAIGGRMSINFNRNKSAYLISNVSSARYSRSIIRKYLDADVYFRMVNYQYRSNELKLRQGYYGASLNYRISRLWSINALYELAARETQRNHRFNTKIIKRFR